MREYVTLYGFKRSEYSYLIQKLSTRDIHCFLKENVFKYNFLLNANVSKRIGCLKDSATDIHYLEDLNKAKIRRGSIRAIEKLLGRARGDKAKSKR